MRSRCVSATASASTCTMALSDATSSAEAMLPRPDVDAARERALGVARTALLLIGPERCRMRLDQRIGIAGAAVEVRRSTAVRPRRVAVDVTASAIVVAVVASVTASAVVAVVAAVPVTVVRAMVAVAVSETESDGGSAVVIARVIVVIRPVVVAVVRSVVTVIRSAVVTVVVRLAVRVTVIVAGAAGQARERNARKQSLDQRLHETSLSVKSVRPACRWFRRVGTARRLRGTSAKMGLNARTTDPSPQPSPR